MMKLPVTLQMYTVRDDAARDFVGTIEQVAKIGYAGVELAGYGGLTAGQVKRALDDNGLFAVASHVGLEQLENGPERAIEESVVLGAEYIVVPYLADSRRGSADAYRQLAMVMNRIGQQVKDAGLQLAYHNHAFEFEKFGGKQYGYDALMEATDPNLVQIELDTFWVQKAGEDPAAYMRRYRGRVPLIHLKDMTPEPESTFAEVGGGMMDFEAIFDAAEEAGGKYYIVEQDVCKNHPPLESIAISFRNLQKMGMA